MENKKNPLETSSILSKRFEQMLYLSLVAETIAFIVSLIASINNNNNISEVYPIFFGVLLTALFIYSLKIRKEKMIVAGVIFIILGIIVLINIAINVGGLRSIGMLGFPVLLTFSSLLGRKDVFIAISTLIGLAVLFIGLNDINGWFETANNPIGIEHIIYIYGFFSVLGFITWAFSYDLKNALSELKAENERVNNSQETIEKLAKNDFLTGLLNRHSCKNKYSDLLRSYDKKNERIFFYFIDLDNFKNINDSFDHLVGDELLKVISKELIKTTKKEDIVSRIGGDEFIVILCREKGYDSEGFSLKLKNIASQPYEISDFTVNVSASIGVAVSPDDGENFDDLRKKSDIAMYQSKKNGKNSYEYYNKTLHKQYLRKLGFIGKFEAAFNNNSLDVLYQPKINMIDNSIIGVEALLRWDTANPQQYKTAEFIPWLENSNSIHIVGTWVINRACQDCKCWHNQGHLITVSVNVSSKEVTRTDFYDTIVKALEVSGLDGNYLEIELTERLWLSDEDTIYRQLRKIKTLGVKLAIDDFGIDYSNLSYLVRFNVDVIKLDFYFVSQVCHSKEHRAIITAIIEMSRVLGIAVVAEGVEKLEEKNALIELGCHIGQGFYWSEALKRANFEQLLLEYSNKSQPTNLTQETSRNYT